MLNACRVSDGNEARATTGGVRLACSVRGCGESLSRDGSRLVCAKGHSFDVARRGYVNLLQPNDRRSSEPGDTREAVAARRRMFNRGFGRALVAPLAAALREHDIDPGATLIDAGCGEGFYLAALCAELGSSGCGVDISTPAVELAAKRYPHLTWVVANADRALPIVSESVDAVVSITARVNAAEFARILRPGGMAVIVVAGADDLAELREAVMGRADEKDRAAVAIEAMSGSFALASRSSFRETAHLDRAALDDLLASTYRGQRRSQQSALAGVRELEVTMEREVLVFAAKA